MSKYFQNFVKLTLLINDLNEITKTHYSIDAFFEDNNEGFNKTNYNQNAANKLIEDLGDLIDEDKSNQNYL